jgi:ATP-dependent Lhr-like helicase
MLSKGVIITVFPDDTLEAIAAVRSARGNRIEPVLYHEKALDVLAHQILGILMDVEEVTISEVAEIVRRAYPYAKLTKSKLLDVIRFLDSLRQLIFFEEGEVLRRTSRSRKQYYNNLSMIPDERRYPVINVISDRKIGTLGDEFMAFDARVGLNFIMRGRVWRIVQIEEETGRVYVVPSEDPFAAIPGWDGEILPVPFDLAQQTGKTREEIGRMLKMNIDAETVAKKLAKKMDMDKVSMLDIVREIAEYLEDGAPLPTQNYILVEAYDKFLIIHACFGEIVNRTLGGVIDSILTKLEAISGWWTDGYRILIEAARKFTRREVEKLPIELFSLAADDIDDAFKNYVNSKFPFAAKMKHVAERFGVLPRGKTMSYERQSKLRAQFERTPIYEETLREAMLERADLKKVKKIMREIRHGKIRVGTLYRPKKPTNLAYHILTKYADISELMAPQRVLLSNIEKMKMAIEVRNATLLCLKCGEWTTKIRITSLPEQPECEECSSGLLTLLYRNQDANHVKDILRRRNRQEQLSEQELKELTQARRKADLILSYGKDAIRALEVKGVGPETASRILGKMHPKEDEFYLDLLKAKIQFLRTREFWKD